MTGGVVAFVLEPDCDARRLPDAADRDIRWRHGLAGYVDQRPIPERAVAVFDWLFDWFRTPGFRGCAWFNAYGELGGLDQEVVR